MIDKELVTESIMIMAGIDYGEAQTYMPFIASAAAFVEENLIEGADENDPRVIQLAAAKAYKSIELSMCRQEELAAFTAGDVSVTLSDSQPKNAEEYYKCALSDCKGLLIDSGFAFLGV